MENGIKGCLSFLKSHARNNTFIVISRELKPQGGCEWSHSLLFPAPVDCALVLQSLFCHLLLSNRMSPKDSNLGSRFSMKATGGLDYLLTDY